MLKIRQYTQANAWNLGMKGMRKSNITPTWVQNAPTKQKRQKNRARDLSFYYSLILIQQLQFALKLLRNMISELEMFKDHQSNDLLEASRK